MDEKLKKEQVDHERQTQSMQQQITLFRKDERALQLEMEQMHNSWAKERKELDNQRQKLEKELKANQTAAQSKSTKEMDIKIERMNEEWSQEKENLIVEVTKKHEAFQE